MDWIAEIWKWVVANLNNWFVMFWWFTIPIFLASAGVRYYLWPKLLAHKQGWGVLALLAITASWPGDWRRLVSDEARPGHEYRFLLVMVLVRGLPLYSLLFIYALGKEYLLVYLVGLAIFLALLLPAGVLLQFADRGSGTDEKARVAVPSLPGALALELWGVGPRFVHGLLTAGLLAALAIHPDWVFPVEITGSGLMSQAINGMLGMAVAIGAWTPPVGAILLSVPLWRGGLALSGLLAFFFVVPIAPQAMACYAQWLGYRQSLRVAMIVLPAALAAALVSALLVSLSGLELPYVYAREQLW